MITALTAIWWAVSHKELEWYIPVFFMGLAVLEVIFYAVVLAKIGLI